MDTRTQYLHFQCDPGAMDAVALSTRLRSLGPLISMELDQVKAFVGAKYLLYPPSRVQSVSRAQVIGPLTCDDRKFNEPWKELTTTRAFVYVDDLGAGMYFDPKSYMSYWPQSKVTSQIIVIDQELKLFGIKFLSDDQQKKIQFKFKDVKSIRVTETETQWKVYIQVSLCPKYFYLEDGQRMTKWYANDLQPGKYWKEAESFIAEGQEEVQKFVGRIAVFKLTITKEAPNATSFMHLLEFPGLPLGYDPVDEIAYHPPSISSFHFLPSTLNFNIKYLLHCLLSFCYTTCYHLSYTFLLRLQLKDPGKTERVLKKILKLRKPYETELQDVPTLFDQLYPTEQDAPTVSTKYQMIPRVLVTPSTVYFTVPEHQLPNRVTRQFKNHINRFLRVSFVTEHLASLISPSEYQLTRIKEKFLPRFKFLDRNYELLAFSSSQLRERSLWMFAAGDGLTRNEIVDWMGDFSGINVSSKRSSRMGLCLTNTEYCLKLEEHNLAPLEEVRNDEYTFSDGVGTISQDLMNVVAETVQEQYHWNIGSAIQIRIRGIKGVVNIDPYLPGKVLKYRPSMSKFPSNHLELEIINFATHRFGYLNRQFITLLSTLNVPDEVFLNLQSIAIQECQSILTRPDQLLKRVTLSMKSEFASPIWEILAKIINNPPYPFNQSNDKFLFEVAKAMFVVAKTEIHERQRIVVEQSALLIGVLDEQGVLGPEEVYVNLCLEDWQHKRSPQNVTGPVAISKNPCFHPGDFRRLHAVATRPGLEHYSNVIVFPRVGDRPHANEISGSDLDGDLFFVTWDPDLTNFEQVTPTLFPASHPQPEDEVTIDSIAHFFTEYMINDTLGHVANMHLAIATMSMRKAFDEICLKLAELHSVAVDFAKTGVKADLGEISVNNWPDFMKKKCKEVFDSSNTVIGKLWRASENIEVEPPELDSYPIPDTADTPDIAKLYQDYKTEIEGIMNIYNIGSEVEVLTGEISTFAKHFKNKNKYKRREETRHKLQMIVREVKVRYENRFRAIQMRARETGQSENLACECLRKAYDESGDKKFYGFPWIVAGDELLRIAALSE